jgi:hypothetical protein
MPFGISIHIGVNYVDKKHYGTRAELPYCLNDAEKMYALAGGLGFKSVKLLDEKAKSTDLLWILDNAAIELNAGDILFLSFSGHGRQFQDLNGDEEDHYDEAWVLYDRMLIDDELYLALARFKKGTRILVISDSCHAGTITKSFDEIAAMGNDEYGKLMKTEADLIYQRNKNRYDPILKSISPKVRNEITASVILLAACQDNQKALAQAPNGEKYSLYTHYLLRTWNYGNFKGNYRRFSEIIGMNMPKTQVPNYFFSGHPNHFFENQKPFTI